VLQTRYAAAMDEGVRDPWGPLIEHDESEYTFYFVSDPLSPDPEALALSRGGWVRVERGGLPHPIYVRIGVRTGRPRIIGVLVDNDQEVTADLLRSIRVGRLLEQFLAGVTDDAPDLTAVKFKYRQMVTEDWIAMREFVEQAGPAPADQGTRARKGQAPTDEALREFAAVYRHHLGTNPRRAMSATASDMHMARSTAYRWADMCRNAGHLPQIQESS
jgi:hypothetical protein